MNYKDMPAGERVKLTAKMIRQELKKCFPGFKFSVTMGQGTCWGTIYVRWDAENLTRAQVEEKIGKFHTYSGWDCYTDISNYDNRRDDVPQVRQIWFNH